MTNRILATQPGAQKAQWLLPHTVVRVDRAGNILEIIQDKQVPQGQSNKWVGVSYHDLLPAEIGHELDDLIAESADHYVLANLTKKIDWQGEEHVVDLHITPGNPGEILLFISDETARHRSEQNTLRLNRALLSLQSAAAAVTLSLNVDHVLDTFTWELTNILDAGGCAVYGRGAEDDRYALLKAYRLDGDIAFASAFAAHLDQLPLVRQVLDERYARQLAPATATDSLPELEFMRSWGVEALLLMPMVFQDRTLGLVLVVTRNARPFSELEISLGQLLTTQAGGAVANAQSHEQTEQQLKAETVLREASQIFSASLDRQKVLDSIAEQLCRTLEATSAYIRSVERDLAASAVAASFIADGSSDETQYPATGLRESHAPELQELLSTGEPLVWHAGEPGIPEQEAERMQRYGGKSVLVVPMMRGGRVMAIAELWESRRHRSFSRSEIGLAQGIAQIAAVALENAGLYLRARREIAERERAESDLEAERAGLAERVEEQTAELRRANAELARAARLKDEFLASMSHELRTPLNAILGIAEGMADQLYGPLNERQVRSLGLVEQSGRHLLSLIDDILDVSKIESGQLSLDLALVPVAATAQSCLQLIKQTASEKELEVTYRNDREVTHLQADARRLKQILINLLSNAVKFTPEKGAVGLDVIGEPERNLVHFVVWDTGIGIRDVDLPELFKPFVQLDSSLARRYNGTGLGLALVKRLTELHGGSVSVESAPGEGSRFKVTLPWRAWDMADSLSASDAGYSQKGAETLPLDGALIERRPLILLAEDDAINAEVFVSCIKSMDLRVTIARDGDEAIRRLSEETPSLILMDIQMPGKSGLDAIREIRQRPETARVPIIALTALAMAGDRDKCLEAGATDYISKPVPLRQLRKAIRSHLEAGGTDQEQVGA